MAILSKQQLLDKIKTMLEDKTDDESIGFIEDVTDTVTDLETKASDTTNWEKKYKDNDAEWRKKYRDRFFNSPSKEDEPEDDDSSDSDEPKIKTYEELFKEG